MQSASDEHIVRQAVGPQTNWSHDLISAGGQLPAPSQVRPLICTPALHEAGSPQVVPAGVCAQVWLAAQAPVLPQTPLGAQEP